MPLGELSSRERLELARGYVAAGLSVIPTRTDGSKAPAIPSWKEYQSRLPTQAELVRWFGGPPVGIAVLGGTVSGGLEILDFDDSETYDEWSAEVRREAPELLAKLSVVYTPAGGYHVYYRCGEVAGNAKLAQRLIEAEVKTVVETRGEGGYVLAPGCPAACHPQGRFYEPQAGATLSEIALLTTGERAYLLDVARLLHEVATPEEPTFPGLSQAELLPGTDFNLRGPDIEHLLPAGWTHAGGRGDIKYWRRPGKTSGHSATSGLRSKSGQELFCVFSPNAAPFPGPSAGRICSEHTKFSVLTLTRFAGDYRAAAKHLAAEGYGDVSKPMCKLVSESLKSPPATEPKPKPRPLLIDVARVPNRCVEWYWHHWMALGSLTIVDGDPGLGKSMLSLDLAARESRGWAMPPHDQKPLGQPGHVLLLSEEDDIATTIRPRFEAAGGDPAYLHVLDGVALGDQERCPVLPADLELVADYVREKEIRLIVVDPFFAYLEDETDSHKDQSIRQVTRRLARFARKHNVLIMLVRHLNKLNAGAALYRGGGSIAILGSARTALLVGREPETKDVMVVAMNKTNLGPRPESLTYKIETTEADVPRIVWGNASALAADEILWHVPAKPQGRPNEQAQKAEELLLEMLKAGSVPVNDIMARAQEVGVSERTLHTVKKKLGIVARRISWAWFWALPEAAPL